MSLSQSVNYPVSMKIFSSPKFQDLYEIAVVIITNKVKFMVVLFDCGKKRFIISKNLKIILLESFNRSKIKIKMRSLTLLALSNL